MFKNALRIGRFLAFSFLLSAALALPAAAGQAGAEIAAAYAVQQADA